MEFVKRKLSVLRVYENNARYNAEAVPKVKASILKYGYKVPIVIDSNNTIIAGHTRFAALQDINRESGSYGEIDCIFANDLTEEQVREFRIVDNSVASIATWDITKLKFELETLPDFDILDFGGIPELSIEDIQIQEEHKLELDSDRIQIRIGPDKIEMTEAEFNQWTSYVIGTYNKSILEFVRDQLHLNPNDRVYETLPI